MIEYLPVVVTILGVITSLSVLLQTLKIMHLHESRDVALPMYIIFLVNSVFWILYGFSISDIPVIITFSAGTLTTLSVIVVYFIYRKMGKFERMKYCL